MVPMGDILKPSLTLRRIRKSISVSLAEGFLFWFYFLSLVILVIMCYIQKLCSESISCNHQILVFKIRGSTQPTNLAKTMTVTKSGPMGAVLQPSFSEVWPSCFKSLSIEVIQGFLPPERHFCFLLPTRRVKYSVNCVLISWWGGGFYLNFLFLADWEGFFFLMSFWVIWEFSSMIYLFIWFVPFYGEIIWHHIVNY